MYFLDNENDSDTSRENSILDVGNDQMFDDSIFTEYDDQNLSCMSTKMTKKWRKKWEKEDLRKRTFGAETIDRLVAKQATLLEEELENLPDNIKNKEFNEPVVRNFRLYLYFLKMNMVHPLIIKHL